MEPTSIFPLFLIGALVGYFLELIFRSLYEKRLVNPGLLKGIYLPIYGFGLLALNYIYPLELTLFQKILTFTIFATAMELFTAYFLHKVFKKRLWDYRKDKYDYRGYITPIFIIYWACASFIYFVSAKPFIDNILILIQTDPSLRLIFVVISIIFVIDLVSTFKRR